MSFTTKQMYSKIRFHHADDLYKKPGMVSTKSLTWTCVVVELVLSAACFLGSLAIIAAQLQSESIYPERQFPSAEWWTFCFLSFIMIPATVFAMFGLNKHKKHLLVPHLFLLAVFILFVARLLLYVVWAWDPADFNWWISVCVLGASESFLLTSLILELKITHNLN